MIIDSYHQYVPFFSEFHDKIWHGESFLYSWHGSLGFNFIAVQAYYLASPLNFLIALFPASMMIEAFEIADRAEDLSVRMDGLSLSAEKNRKK